MFFFPFATASGLTLASLFWAWIFVRNQDQKQFTYQLLGLAISAGLAGASGLVWLFYPELADLNTPRTRQEWIEESQELIHRQQEMIEAIERSIEAGPNPRRFAPETQLSKSQ